MIFAHQRCIFYTCTLGRLFILAQTREVFYICTHHTREVLLEEGLAEAEVDDLIARGVVGQAEPKAKL